MDRWDDVLSTDDAHAQLVMSGAPPIRGPADIRRTVEEMIKTGAKVHIDVETNVGAGDIAYVYGSYTISDGKVDCETEGGSYVEVWRWQDGAWAIVLDVNALGEPLHPKCVSIDNRRSRRST